MYRKTRLRAWAAAALAGGTLAAGCVVAAVGAGAGGGVYFTERGAESVVPASVDRAATAAQHAFADLKIRETKSETQHTDVSVTITSQEKTTRVQVVAKKSAVTWDKDFARTVLDKIVAYSR